MKIRNVYKYILALLFKIVPRNEDLWVTGKSSEWEYENSPPQFFDNSKYLYLYLVNHTNEKVYWLSSSDSEYELLRDAKLPVVRLNSVKGRYLTLRAKYIFHHYGPAQIDRILEYGSIQIDLWHGTPLKKIRYDVAPKADFKLNFIAKYLDNSGCEYVSSTSKKLSDDILKHAFDVKENQMLNFGYPRMDIMKLEKNELISFCKKYSKTLLSYIEVCQNKKVFLYMPTYRDDDVDYFSKANIDFHRLNYMLKETNSIFFLKLHPLTKEIDISGYENIVQISNDTDIYPFLKFVDYLITDYSSIFFDFLVLDREMIFIPYDFDNYIKNRSLYFDYDEITPGKKFNTFNEFIDNIHNIDSYNYSKERKNISNYFLCDYNFDASEKIYSFFKN